MFKIFKNLFASALGKYEGEYNKDGKRHGKGKITFRNGTYYEGEWKNDLSHGQGTLTYSDGSIYKGEFKFAKKDGKGTQIFPKSKTHPDGAKYVGEFKNDLYNGYGKFYMGEEEWENGMWKDGVPIDSKMEKVRKALTGGAPPEILLEDEKDK